MKRRFVLSALPAALLGLTGAVKAKRTAKLPRTPPPRDLEQVELVTQFGTIVVELDRLHAPLTVANFMRYVDSGRYNGMNFYRSMHFGWGTEPNGLVQGGLHDFPARLLPPVAHEPTTLTGIKHLAGTLSMARNAPGTANADFSILLADTPYFDADPKGTTAEARAGYAAFGRVISGMDVARTIYDAPRSATKGAGVMKGQLLDPVIKVPKVRRAAAPQTSPAGGGGSAKR